MNKKTSYSRETRYLLEDNHSLFRDPTPKEIKKGIENLIVTFLILIFQILGPLFPWILLFFYMRAKLGG